MLQLICCFHIGVHIRAEPLLVLESELIKLCLKECQCGFWNDAWLIVNCK